MTTKTKDQQAETAETIHHALLGAQRAIESVGKDATNSFHKYRYTSSEQMIGACRQALHSAGLTLHRGGWELGADGQTVTSVFILAHSRSGATLHFTIPWIVIAEKGRPLDKALAGALTTSLGYFLRDLLLLPREDEEVSMDRRDDSRAQAGFKPQDRPSAVSDLNQRIASEAKPKQQQKPQQAKELDIVGKILRVFTKTVAGADYTMVSIDDNGDRFDAVAARSAGDVSGLQGKACAMRLSMPEGRTPQLVSASAVDASGKEEPDESELPF